MFDYNMHSLITERTSKAGTLVAYHPFKDPDKYQDEIMLKKICCEDAIDKFLCEIYLQKRPIDDGMGYHEPIGG